METRGYALHLACERNLTEAAVEKLVEMNPAALDETSGNLSGWYPIHCAIHGYYMHTSCYGHGSIAIIKLIMEADPRANTKQTSKGESPLHLALSLRLIDVVELILQQSNVLVNIKDNDTMTALHRACSGCKYDIIEQLLQHPDIDINARDKNDETPLHLAIKTDQLRIIQKLLDQSLVDINPTIKRNITPLDLVEERIQKARNKHDKLNTHLDRLKKEQLKKRIQLLTNIKNLFVEYPVKRRWISYQYYLNSQQDL